jgi:soluble lytic murein transglycosylase
MPMLSNRLPRARLSIGLLMLLALVISLSACQNRASNNAVTPTPTAHSSIQNIRTTTPSPQTSPAATVVHNIPVESSQAYQALDEGDYQTAISITTRLLALSDLPSREALQLILAQAYLAEGQPQPVMDLLAPLADSGSHDEVTLQALGLVARAYEASQLWPKAIAAYMRFLELRPEVAPDVHWHLAQLYTRAGDNTQAIHEYRQVDPAAYATSQRAVLLEETATTLRSAGSYDDALLVYDSILSFAQYASYRALVLSWQGDTLMEAGHRDEAIARWQQVYEVAPDSIAAYLALQSLDKADEHPFTPLQEAWILYHAGQYEPCLQAITRITPVSGAQTTEVYYLRGLVAAKQKDFTAAVQAYDQALAGDIDSSLLAEVWLAKAHAIEAAGENPVETYRLFVERYPDSPYAVTALWQSALYSQEHGAWSEAERDYGELRVAYPTHELSIESNFREGLMAYAATDVSRAQQIWLELKSQAGLDASMQTRLLYWLGIAAWRLDGIDNAKSYWVQVSVSDPYGYYGQRAQDHMAGSELKAGAQPRSLVVSGTVSELDYLIIGDWIDTWYSDTQSLPNLGQDPLYLRAIALWDLGWHNLSQAAFTQLLDKYAQQPKTLLALARLGWQYKAYSASVDSASDLMHLAWAAGETTIPLPLWRLAYPVPFNRLISSVSQGQGVAASLLLALVRQESQFDAQALSPAGAMGLAQIMPGTGEYIASQLGIASFQDQMLLAPQTSLSFGAWYLAQTLKAFDGDILAGLAAYNAGPGTVQTWLQPLDFADSDLFFELVPYAETRNYIRQVYLNYRVYERITQ